MRNVSYGGYRFSPEIIRRAVWPYLQFTRDVVSIEAANSNVARGSPVADMIPRFEPPTENPMSHLALKRWPREEDSHITLSLRDPFTNRAKNLTGRLRFSP